MMNKEYIKSIIQIHICYSNFFELNFEFLKKQFCILIDLSSDEKYLYLKISIGDQLQWQVYKNQASDMKFESLFISTIALFYILKLFNKILSLSVLWAIQYISAVLYHKTHQFFKQLLKFSLNQKYKLVDSFKFSLKARLFKFQIVCLFKWLVRLVF